MFRFGPWIGQSVSALSFPPRVLLKFRSRAFNVLYDSKNFEVPCLFSREADTPYACGLHNKQQVARFEKQPSRTMNEHMEQAERRNAAFQGIGCC